MTKKSIVIAICVGISSLDPHATSSAQTLEEAFHMMLQQEPELQPINYDSQSAFQTWKIARGDLFPQVTVNGSTGISEHDRSTDGLVSQSGDTLWSNQVVPSWNIYRGGANKATNQLERLQLAKAGELLRAADQQREYQLRLTLAEKEGSRASSRSLEQYVDKLAWVMDDYEEQFRIGQIELPNILDVRNEHYQTRSRLIDSRFNEDAVDDRILGTQGRLVQHLIGDSLAAYATVDKHSDGKGDVATAELTKRTQFFPQGFVITHSPRENPV